MSTTPPPDRPTEPLRPAHPAPVLQERVVVAPVVDPNTVVDPNLIMLRLEDAIDSLRTGLMIVGVIAVAALGVAIYALLDDDTGRSASTSRSDLASDSSVTQLENRVDRLSSQLQTVRGGSRGGADTAAVSGRIDELERTVRTLSARPAAGDATQAIEQLSGRVDELSRDVQQLEQTPAP